MNPDGGMAQSCREEDPRHATRPAGDFTQGFLCQDVGPHGMSSHLCQLKTEKEPRIWLRGENYTLPFVGSDHQG
jgi:hypothetical protein